MHDAWEGAPLTVAADTASTGRPPLLVAVLLHRNPEFVAQLAAALVAMADELRALDATLLLIDDAPEHAGFRGALDKAMPMLTGVLHVERVRDPATSGPVRGANLALARGRDDGRDVLLLTDALPRPGAFAEMAAVAALDPLTAVVGPRSDNAGICTSPDADELRRDGPERAYAAHRAIERHLPRVSYVPTAAGFCMLIRHAMLREFGLFDEAYGAGDHEADFIRRCNRRGYRAVLANRAYVHHLGELPVAPIPTIAQTPAVAQTDVAGDARDADDRAILIERYPEYDAIVARWFEGAEYRAQRLLSGLVPADDGRLRLLFDCGLLSAYHNGTFEYIRALLTAFAGRHAERYDVTVLCTADAFAFHGLDRVAGLRRTDARGALARPAALAVRLSQPFSDEDLAPLCDYAALCGVVMLDTIAMDCQQLDDVGLGALWATMADDVDALGFISDFSRDQFRRRFDVPARVVEFISRCSTDPADYADGDDRGRDGADAGEGVLIVGNHYPHKHVRETLATLRAAAPGVPVTVLGLDMAPEPGVAAYAAGDLPQAIVDDLYRRARVVLFPSHYEGFGLPIVHALARRRPVIARDLPSAREIRASSAAGDNIHLAGSTDEMVALAIRPPPWRDASSGSAPAPAGWNAAADAMADAVALTLARFDFAECRRRQDRALARRAAGSGAAQAAADDARGLPAHGDGFMLGEMIEVAPPARLSARRMPRLLFRTRQRAGGVRYDANLDRTDADAISRALLERLHERPVGTAVVLALDAGDRRATARVAAAILIGCGCAVSSIEDGARGVVAHGVYRRAWTALLAGPEDDTGFVRHVYRHALGRNPDPEGAKNYVAELAGGLTRVDMLRLFLGSAERRDAITAQMRRRGIEV